MKKKFNLSFPWYVSMVIFALLFIYTGVVLMFFTDYYPDREWARYVIPFLFWALAGYTIYGLICIVRHDRKISKEEKEKKEEMSLVMLRIPKNDDLNVHYCGKPGVYGWSNGDVIIKGKVIKKTSAEHVIELNKENIIIVPNWIVEKYKVKWDYSEKEYLKSLLERLIEDPNDPEDEAIIHLKNLKKMDDFEIECLIDDMEEFEEQLQAERDLIADDESRKELK